MNESRNEARRRKILDNAKKRLEKLEGLKRHTQHDDEGEEEENEKKSVEDESSELLSDNKIIEESTTEESVSSTMPNQKISKEYCITKEDDRNDTENDTSETSIEDETVINQDTSHELSWFFRKHRLILFSLLAWVVYLVVVKDFDNILAYFIGKRLPKDVLPTLFLTAFIGVELQIVVLALLVKRKTTDTKKTQSMVWLALSLSGIPSGLLDRFLGLLTCLGNIFTDFCVYVWVIIMLKVVDDYIY